MTIPAGETSAEIQVQVDDGSGQASAPTESFEVELTSTGSSGLEISPREGSAFGLIEVPGLHGSVYDLKGNGLENVPLKLSGTASSGATISRTLSTNTAGGYQVNVDPGTYTLAPNGDPPSEPAGLEYGANPCPGSSVKGTCTGIVLTTGFATASFTYGCGANLELNRVSYGVEHTHGARINTPVTLVGKGFCAGMSVQFGNAKAVVSPPPESIGPGGTSVEVTVPRLATSGTLSVTSGGKTKSLSETFAVDSFRDTDAFGFENFDAPPTLADFLHTFGVQNTMQPLVINVCPGGHCPTTELVPTWAALDAYANLSKDFGGGVCWGWDFEAQRLSDGGDTPLSSISPEASVPWDLAESPELKTKITQMQWAQYSNQVSAIQRTSPTLHNGATILAEVSAALQGGVEAGSNGVMIGIEAYYKKTGWEGHELLAYDVEPQPNGGFNIDVADPNQPFTASENAPDGSAHAAVLQRSTIAVGPGGRWSYAPLGWEGNSRRIDIEPYPALINAIHGGLTYSQPGAGRLKTSIAPATTLSSLIDPAGQAVEIEEPSAASGVDFTPVRNGSGPADYSFEAPEGTYAETLSGAAPSELISTDGLLADIEASSGTDAVSFDPQTASLEFGPGASSATPSPRALSSSARARSSSSGASHTVTLSLVATSAAAERTVKLTGPSGAGLNLAFTHSEAGVKLSGASGTYSLTLSAAGQASAVKLKVGRGETVTLKPRWSALSGKGVIVQTHGTHGHPRSELLGDRLRAPHATIGTIKDDGRSVGVGLDLPSLVSGSSVNVYVTVLRGSRKLAQQSAALLPGAHASHRHLRLKLPSTPPRGSAIAVLALTRSDAGPPQIATSERTIHLR